MLAEVPALVPEIIEVIVTPVGVGD